MKQALILLLLIVAAGCSSQTTIVGKWKSDESSTISVFEANGTCHTERIKDGETTITTLPTEQITYVADYTVNPHKLVISIKNQTGETSKVYSLFNFKDNNTMERVISTEGFPDKLDTTAEGYTVLHRVD